MFLNYIHSFRGIAITYIVAGHCVSIFDWSDAVALERWLKIIFGNGTVLFVFIAGYLFQYLSGKYDVKKYMISKLKNVISPYILISIPGIYFSVFIQQRGIVWDGFYDYPIWEQIFYFYITGLHVTALWFIPMITLFYLVSPLLVKLDRNKKIYYFLPVFIAISCFIPRGGYLVYLSFVHFFSVYLLGMCCCRYKDKINEILRKTRSVLLLGSLVISCIVIEYYFMQGTMTWVNLLGKLFLCLFYLGLLIRLEVKYKNKLLVLLANLSFGIYFIHSYYITAVKLFIDKYWGNYIGGDVFKLILATILIVLICYITVWLVKLIFAKKSRLIIGS